MRLLTQGHFSKLQKGGKSCEQAKKKSISYKKTMNESTVLPSTFYPRPSTKTYTLFHTITSLWVEFSLSTLYFYDSSPTVFSRFGMDLAGNLDSCYLTRYPKTDDFFRQKSTFLLTDECVLDFCCCVVLCFAEEIYISPHRDVRMMLTSVGHWTRSEKSIREPAPRPLASGSFSSLSRNVFSLLDLHGLSQDSRVSREHENRREETGERKGPSFLLPPPPFPPFSGTFHFRVSPTIWEQARN